MKKKYSDRIEEALYSHLDEMNVKIYELKKYDEKAFQREMETLIGSVIYDVMNYAKDKHNDDKISDLDLSNFCSTARVHILKGERSLGSVNPVNDLKNHHRTNRNTSLDLLNVTKQTSKAHLNEELRSFVFKIIT